MDIMGFFSGKLSDAQVIRFGNRLHSGPQHLHQHGHNHNDNRVYLSEEQISLINEPLINKGKNIVFQSSLFGGGGGKSSFCGGVYPYQVIDACFQSH